jgi:hypothetical protein
VKRIIIWSVSHIFISYNEKKMRRKYAFFPCVNIFHTLTYCILPAYEESRDNLFFTRRISNFSKKKENRQIIHETLRINRVTLRV